MKTRRLGAKGPEIAALGYGAMSLGNAWGEVDDAGSDRLLHALADRGISHVDTANIYGMGLSETRIGRWIAHNGNRFALATKAGIVNRDGRRGVDNRGSYLMAELEGSLKRLNVDHVDLFYVHRRQAGFPLDELAEGLAAILASGKARSVGISEIAPTSLRQLHALVPVAAVQSEYSLQTRAPDLGLVRACAELGVALVAFSPVGRGLLTDRPPSPEMAAANFFMRHNPRFQSGALQRNTAFLAPLRAYAADLGLTTAGLAVAWTLSRGDHVVPIPGTRSPAHLDELVQGAERGLTADELAEIERLAPPGWCEGDRYGDDQWNGPERYC